MILLSGTTSRGQAKGTSRRSPTRRAKPASALGRGEAREQPVEHEELSLRRYSIRYVDPLDAQAVDERHEFVRCEVKVESLDEFVQLSGLFEMSVETRPELIDFVLAEFTEPVIGQHPPPEAHLDARLEVALLVERESLEHGNAQCGHA